ncbi:MAG: hypothetical protein QOH95_953 [Gaiellaceae bacterium]|nr:hypothetical protein [Gaiellaceae bacterium]
MKRLLLLAILLAVVLPGPASAAGPCRNKIYNDWLRDGKVASTYPKSCYQDALKHIPLDLGVYSSLSDDIRAAMRASLRRAKGLSAPSQVGHGLEPVNPSGVKSAVVSVKNVPRDPHDPRPGVVPTAVAAPHNTSLAATASGAPLPILVLGGLALALVAAGAVGVGVRHARGRSR